MQQREKVLLAGFAVAAGIWVLKPFAESTFVAPLVERGEQIVDLKRDADDKEFEEIQLMKAEARLRGYKERSFPPNPQDAHRLYLEWLTDIAQMSGMTGLKFTLGSQQTVENTFVTIPVTIVAEATTDQILRFVQLFESADLLHRLARFHAASPSNDGDPRLTVTIVAEGVSMKDAKPRTRLFPQTTLIDGIDVQKADFKIAATKEFSEPLPFLVRSGLELMRVTAVDGEQWTVERGANRTVPAAHPPGTFVELFPVKPMTGGENDPQTIVARLGAGRFFVKPQPLVVYKPRFAAIPVQRATRGTPFTYTLKVEGWNPAFGKPAFRLESGMPAGMTIDAATGVIRWSPPADFTPGPVQLSAVASSTSGTGEPVSTKFSLDVRPANHAPRLTVPASVTVYIGRNTTVELAGVDSDLPDDRLSYAFEGPPPPGARIDTRTGRIDWSAPPETELGPKTFTVIVRDNGDPPLSASATLNVKFEDDAAFHTYLVGCLAEGEGRGEAILHDRTTNQTLRLHPGDLIRRADLEAVILDIHPGDIVFASGADVFRLDFGRQMRQAEKLPLPPVKSPTSTVTPTAAAAQNAAGAESKVPDSPK